MFFRGRAAHRIPPEYLRLPLPNLGQLRFCTWYPPRGRSRGRDGARAAPTDRLKCSKGPHIPPRDLGSPKCVGAEALTQIGKPQLT